MFIAPAFELKIVDQWVSDYKIGAAAVRRIKFKIYFLQGKLVLALVPATTTFQERPISIFTELQVQLQKLARPCIPQSVVIALA